MEGTIFVPIGVILLGVIFYAISYLSPKTDIFFYAISAVLFLLGGTLGVIGYNEYPTFEVQQIFAEEQVDENTTVTEITKERIEYSNFIISNMMIMFVLISIYQFVGIASLFWEKM